MKPPVTHNNALDLYKLWFTICVMIYHSCIFVEDRSVAYAQGGWLAVEFFFMVSGYLMVCSARKQAAPHLIGQETFRFVVHKALRLFPTYLFAYVISFIYMHLYTSLTLKTLIKDFVRSIIPFFFLEQSGIDGYVVTGATWYISAMFIAMLVLYPLLLKFPDYFLWVLSPLVVILGYGYMYQSFGGLPGQFWHTITYACNIRAFTGLCLGACCYLGAEYLSKLKLKQSVRLLLTGAELVLLVGASAVLWANSIGTKLYPTILAFALIIVLTFSGQTYTAKAFERFNTKYIVQLSLAIYLCHGRVPGLVGRICPAGMPYNEMLPIYLLIVFGTVLFCLLFVNLVVWRKMRWKHHVKLN